MADYSPDQMNSMREKAIMRAKEMQQRYINYSQNNTSAVNNTPTRSLLPPATVVQNNNTQRPSQNNFQQLFQMNMNEKDTKENNNLNTDNINEHATKISDDKKITDNNKTNAKNFNHNTPNFQQTMNSNPLSSLLGNLFGNSGSSPDGKKKNYLSSIIEGVFPDLKLDDDKIIIIILIIILSRNGADMKLLIALGYLLM